MNGRGMMWPLSGRKFIDGDGVRRGHRHSRGFGGLPPPQPGDHRVGPRILDAFQDRGDLCRSSRRCRCQGKVAFPRLELDLSAGEPPEPFPQIAGLFPALPNTSAISSRRPAAAPSKFQTQITDSTFSIVRSRSSEVSHVLRAMPRKRA
jgi:hypothetical protein